MVASIEGQNLRYAAREAMAIQDELAKLRREDVDAVWRGKPNEWLRHLSPPTLSGVAIQLVATVTRGARNQIKSLPHKVAAGERRIDLKVATLSEISGAPALGWRNIRDLDRVTHVAFLAIYPSNSRLFVVPVHQIPSSALKATSVYGQHQVVLSSAYELPDWLEIHELCGIVA